MWIILLLLFGIGAPSHADAVPTCPSDMVLVRGHGVCVDRYEWPNRKGAKPAVAISAVPSIFDKDKESHNAEALCASVGKRMCEMEEWTAACRGKGNADYPFGRELPDRSRTEAKDAPCNYARFFREPDYGKIFARDEGELERLNQSDPSGEREQCVSASGAHDMMGNVEEWIRCPRWMSKSGANCSGSKKDGDEVCYCFAGRYWSAPVKCGEIIAGHAPGYHDYESGTRCCADPTYVKE